MQYPFILLLISFVLGHLTRIEVSQGVAIYFHDILAAFMAVTVFIRHLGKKRFPEAKLTKPIIIFIFATVLSLLFGAQAVEGKQVLVGGLYLVRWVALASIYFYLLDFKKAKTQFCPFVRRLSLREALLLSGLSLTVLGLLQYCIFPDLTQLKWLGWDDHAFRLVGTLLDPGFTGIILVLTLLLTLGTREGRWVKLTAVGLPASALLLTYSRASYLSFLFGILVYALLKKMLKKAVISGIVFLLLIFFLPRAASEGTNLRRLYSLTSRVETWKRAIVIIKDQPLTGVGFNLLRYTQKDYAFLGKDWQTSHSASGVENSYLFIVATSGVLGGFSFAWLLYSIGKLVWQLRFADPDFWACAVSSIWAISIHAIFNNTWFYPWVMIWIWVLAAEAETILHRRQSTLMLPGSRHGQRQQPK